MGAKQTTALQLFCGATQVTISALEKTKVALINGATLGVTRPVAFRPNIV